MHKHPAITPHAAVKIALEQRDASAPGSPIVEVLARTAAPLTAVFWTEAAAELHRRDLHFDAFDCWTRALQVDVDSVDRRDMASALWTVSSGEGFLAEEALRAYESIGAWQDVAYLRFRLGHAKPSVLQAIELALEEKPSTLDWVDYWNFDEFSDIWGWYALGHYHLKNQALPKAIWAFGKALVAEPDDPNLIKSVADTLVEYVKSNERGGKA